MRQLSQPTATTTEELGAAGTQLAAGVQQGQPGCAGSWWAELGFSKNPTAWMWDCLLVPCLVLLLGQECVKWGLGEGLDVGGKLGAEGAAGAQLWNSGDPQRLLPNADWTRLGGCKAGWRGGMEDLVGGSHKTAHRGHQTCSPLCLEVVSDYQDCNEGH